MTKYNIHVTDAVNAAGSFCTTDSERHVDVVTGVGAAIAIQQATDRGDSVTVWGGESRTFDSRHGVHATEDDDHGMDTHAPAKHRC
jgi:hypothetical protein